MRTPLCDNFILGTCDFNCKNKKKNTAVTIIFFIRVISFVTGKKTYSVSDFISYVMCYDCTSSVKHN